MQLVAYCAKHCVPRPELSGVKPATADAADAADGSENGLWNAQPFEPPPCATPPACHEGCARAQAFDGARNFHGTGAGCGWGDVASNWSHLHHLHFTPGCCFDKTLPCCRFVG